MSKMPIVAAFALFASSAVQADALEDTSLFQSLDTDANGSISAEEAAANPDLHARWMELDTDKNNQLDTSEFSAFEASPGKKMDNSGVME